MKPILKRLMCLGLTLLCMAQLLLPVAAQEQPEQTEIFYTTKVYASPKSKSSVMGQLENGTVLTVLGQTGAHYRVDCYGQTGYIPTSQVQAENGEYYVNCQEDSVHTKTVNYLTLEQAMATRAEVIANGRKKLGCPYVYGSKGPWGFDCSGFTGFVFQQSGYSLTRCSDTQPADGIIVPKDSLQVGDLLFFSERNRSGIGHVAIYAGDGKMLHADSRGVVCTSIYENYYASRFVCARRVIQVRAAQVEELTVTTAGSARLRMGGNDLR